MLISLSTLLRGSTYERLKWTFTLYDLNKDGYITKQEVLNVIVAVHELMGFHASPVVSSTYLYVCELQTPRGYFVQIPISFIT